MIKKIFLITTLLIFSLKAFAGEVGYVDYKVIFEKLPDSVKYQKQIDVKMEQIKKVASEAQKQIDSQKKDEDKRKVAQKKVDELKKMKKEYVELRKKQQEVVKKKVETASIAVIKTNKVSTIISKKYIVAGGIDVTNDILKAAK